MRHSRRRVLLVLGTAGLLGGAGAGSAQNDVVDLGPLPQPVTVLVAQEPLVTAFVRGDYGEVRMTGVLADAPKAALRLVDPSGRTREAGWAEVRSLGLVSFAAEGLPVGSYQVLLVSDPPGSPQLPGAGGYGSRVLSTGTGGWRLSRVPEGSLTLRGEPYGTLTIPLDRLAGLQMEPIRGNVAELPKGSIRLEVFAGKSVSLPLTEVRLLQRDASAGTATVVLRDDQTFTGKLQELPKVNLVVETERGKQTVAMDRVAQFERGTPASRRF